MERLFFIAFLALFILSSCYKEPAMDYDTNFIGEWHSDTLIDNSGNEKEIYMKIDPAGCEYGFMCSIHCTSCPCIDVYSGKAKIKNNHKKMRLGEKGRATYLRINKYPYLENGQWVCEIEKVKLYKR